MLFLSHQPKAKAKAFCGLSQVVLSVTFYATDFGIIARNIKKFFPNLTVATVARE